MYSEEMLYAIALRHCPLVGDIIFRKLVSRAGSAREVWELSRQGLKNIEGIGLKISAEIGNGEHLRFAEKELKFCEKHNIKINLRHLKELPLQLNTCDDAPAILYQRGDLPQNRKNISIVGTRNITAYGKHFVQELLEEIKSSDVCTVSGLALGVDTEVHQVSLEQDIPTIAVLAHGFHTLYPSRNRRLAEKILSDGGALLSEFNSSQKPDRENFIQRNRIIAGLSEATVVVETAFGGGSVSTATFANGYNRDVYALPGKIYDTYSQGCNMLIVQNKAAAVSTVSQLAEVLNLKQKPTTGELFPSCEIKILLTEQQEKLLASLQKNTPQSLDDLCEKLNTASYKILPDLLQLEISGLIRATAGRQYIAL